jgi:hypothetical protein
MTGDEWSDTAAAAREHVLPLLSEHRVRFAQVARASASQTDGIVVLDDSTTPAQLHIDGAYKLSDEMNAAGTVPQAGGARLCSAKAKGFPLDTHIASVTDGRAYQHYIGYHATEQSRARRDARYNTALRTGRYPLQEWGWDRQMCVDYIAARTGAQWPKSACVYCPFALTSNDGRARTLSRYRDHVDAAVQSLLMEHTSVSLNPNQGLVAGRRLADIVAAAGEHDIQRRFREALDATPHALYHVRRLLRPKKLDATRLANAARSLRTVRTGNRELLIGALAELAESDGVAVDQHDGIQRVYRVRRGATLPTSEEFFVVAPAGVADKQHPPFEDWWSGSVHARPELRPAPGRASPSPTRWLRSDRSTTRRPRARQPL